MSTPILPFAVWAPGGNETNQNSIPANDNSLRNQVLNGLVISDSTDAQPGSPSDGDIYIMTGAASGAQWATFDEFDLAIFDSGTWYAFAPVEGIIVNLAGTAVQWDGAAYTATGSGAGDVVGPGSAVSGNVPVFDGTSGKIIEDSGESIASIRSMPQNSQSTGYTLVLADAGKHILHPSADTTPRTFTIPANSGGGGVAFPIGTAVTFINQDGAGSLTIAITSDVMRLAGVGTTGSRTLAPNGVATAVKIEADEWIISGVGLT